MNKTTLLVVSILSCILFAIPFFWLAPGFVDLGGDAGRLYFLDAFATAFHVYKQQNVSGASVYAGIPYQFFLGLIQLIVASPTYRIAIDHGLQLSFSFFFMVLLVRELLVHLQKTKLPLVDWIAMIAGVVYVGFISKSGWVTSLESHNQVFLNPLVSFLLLRLLITGSLKYGLFFLFTTIVFSYNFGFSSTPQIFSFFPLAFVFLCVYVTLILRRPLPWKTLGITGSAFVGLHAFHLIPMTATILIPGGTYNARIFSQQTQQNDGVYYFDAIRQQFGKLSLALFYLSPVVPIISMLGFITQKKKMLLLAGGFFAITFFLVTANITNIGVRIYRKLFYIPGFLMFRSFDDKWYFVFVFFYTLIFAMSLYLLLRGRKNILIFFTLLVVVVSTLHRLIPFASGAFYKTFSYQSQVPITFRPDPDMDRAISFIRSLPDNGKFLTLPLTLPVYQVAFGKEGGAYLGLSMVRFLAGFKDYPGFWSFGIFQKPMIEALRAQDAHQTMQILSLLNIRYIFRNHDPRIFRDFPRYPFYRFDITQDIPPINTQDSYDAFLANFPSQRRFGAGFFSVSELSSVQVRPTVYVADVVHASAAGVLRGSSFRSAYVDNQICLEFLLCDQKPDMTPKLTFKRVSPQEYTFEIVVREGTKPFLLVLSDLYHNSWELTFTHTRSTRFPHIGANGYANGWIIDPKELGGQEIFKGRIKLGFERNFVLGRVISLGTVGLIAFFLAYQGVKTYGKKN